MRLWRLRSQFELKTWLCTLCFVLIVGAAMFVLGLWRPLLAQPQPPEQSPQQASATPAIDYSLFNQPGPLWLPAIDLGGQDLAGVTLTAANLHRANFDGASLVGADLSGAELLLATLRGTDLTNANLQNATLGLADLRTAKLHGADLSGARLHGAMLSSATLERAILRSADLHQGDLRRADLRSADLRGAILSGVNLQGADLSNANFSGADLSGANLGDSKLSGMIWDDVVFDAATIWPANFDPISMRVIGPLANDQADGRRSVQDLTITMTLLPDLVPWFRQTARPDDIALVDRAQDIELLDGMAHGSRMVIFKSVYLAEAILPHIADRVDIVGYNLEHGPLNPLAEQNDPVASVRRMRALVDTFGLRLALGLDHDFALSHGAELAPFVDIYTMQVQRVQRRRQTVRDFVVPMAAAVRAANPTVETSLQVRTEGDAAQIAALINSIRDSIDNVAILSSRDTVDTAVALVDLLRGKRPVPESESEVRTRQSKRASQAKTLIMQLLVVVLILLFMFRDSASATKNRQEANL